jgi:hypothetical protein
MSDMGEHRVAMLGASLRRHEDPARSSDPRIRTLVARLAELDPAPAPSAEFRDELRAQLVAVTPRLVAEGVPTATDPAVADRGSAAARLRHTVSAALRLPLRRPVAVVGGVLTVFIVLLGGAVWISQRALPGDQLYGLKRASEDVQLSLASGDTGKAKQYLSLAETRAKEVRDLLSRAGGTAEGAGIQAAGSSDAHPLNSHTAALITSTLSSFDSDVRKASTLLGGEAVRNVSSSPLQVMIAWAPAQLSRLESLGAAMPTSALQVRTITSAQLIAKAYNRAEQLKALTGCACLNGASSDALGPIPCRVCTAAPHATTPGAPSTGRTPAPGGTGGSAGGSTPASGSRTAGRTGPATSGAKGGGAVSRSTGPAVTNGSSSPGGLSVPTLPVPSLPVPSLPIPTLPGTTLGPISTNSCGVGVSLGPIGIGLGTCGAHIHA